MAQRSTSFDDSAYSIGSQPPDWTARWETSSATSDFDIESDTSGCSFGDQVLQITKASNDACGLSWDDVGSQATVDVTMRWRSSLTTGDGIGIILRGDHTSGGLIGYILEHDIVECKLRIWKFNEGSNSSLTNTLVAYDFTSGNWFWSRFQINGTALKARVWEDGEDEPATWNLETTNAEISDAGWCGLYNYSCEGEIDWFGAGDSGDGPPSAPSAEGDARVTQITVEVLRAVESKRGMVTSIGQ